MKRSGMLALFVLLVALAAGLYLLERRPASHAPAVAAPDFVAAEGKVEAMPGYDVNLGTAELNSRVVRILVQEGEEVAAGQLVATLENADLQARVATAGRDLAVAESRLREVESGARREEILQAAASLDGAVAVRDEAARQFRRSQELREQGMLAVAALDERERALKLAESRVREAEQHKRLLEAGPKPETVKLYRDQVAQARANLAHSRSLLDRTQVRAPIAGRVIKRYLDEGEGVTPEIPILAIADMRHLWVSAEIDETDIGRVHLGDPATITAEAYPRQVFKGRVKQIADYAGQRAVRPNDPTTNLGLKVVPVKIELEQATPLRLGMTVDVRIGGPTAAAVTSRQSAE